MPRRLKSLVFLLPLTLVLAGVAWLVVGVKGAETEQSAKLRENFGIPNKPKGLAETRADWDRAVPAWIKAAVDLGVKLD